MLLCLVILIVAAILIYNFIIKPDVSESTVPETTYSIPASATTPAAEQPVLIVADTDTKPATTTVGTVIGTFAELNTVAAESDAVFVYLPGNDGQDHTTPESSMREAVKTIESRLEVKISLITLRPDSPDHEELAGQMSLPAVLAMVKGGGMIPVSGAITASDLVHGFFTAASPAGCASGCR